MAFTARVDIVHMRQRVMALNREVRHAGHAGLAYVVEQMLDRMIAISPADTNRYKRGWQMVANQLGFPRPVLPVVQSARRNGQRKTFLKQLARAREQLDYWTARVNRLQADGHTGWKTYATAQRFQRRAEKVVERAQEVLAEFDDSVGAIVIGGRRKTSGFYGRSQLASPRLRTFGGQGSYITLPGGARQAIGRHLEPHARLVEYGASKRAKRLGRDGQELSATIKTPAYRVLRQGLQHARAISRQVKRRADLRLPSGKGPVRGN